MSDSKPQHVRELQRLQILRTALIKTGKFDDEDYRNVLSVHGRVQSSKELDGHGRRQVIQQLESRLKAIDPKNPKIAPWKGRPRNMQVSDRQELQKIEALLADAGRDWTYADGLAKRMYKRDRVQLCAGHQLVGILSALHNDSIRRLSAELQQLFGPGWDDRGAGIASWLFGFDSQHRSFASYPQAMSQVLRWWRGELKAACQFPVDVEKPKCCSGCYQIAVSRSDRHQ